MLYRLVQSRKQGIDLSKFAVVTTRWSLSGGTHQVVVTRWVGEVNRLGPHFSCRHAPLHVVRGIPVPVVLLDQVRENACLYQVCKAENFYLGVPHTFFVYFSTLSIDSRGSPEHAVAVTGYFLVFLMSGRVSGVSLLPALTLFGLRPSRFLAATLCPPCGS